MVCNEIEKLVPNTARYSELSKTSKMHFFAKIVNGFQPLTIFTKSSNLDL